MHAAKTVIDFEQYSILLDGERIEKESKLTWRAIKERLKKGVVKIKVKYCSRSNKTLVFISTRTEDAEEM